MGVVHHSNYFRWFEMGRVAWLRAAGVELWELMNANIIFPITHVECNYKESALYDDEIEICATMTAFTRAKMDFKYQIVRKKDGAVLAEGASRNVFTDSNGHITRLSGAFYDRINAYITLKSRRRRSTDGRKIRNYTGADAHFNAP